MTCGICAYAVEHGSWPADFRGTHCDCHRSWTASKEAHCCVCHQHFSVDTLADKHRVGGHCMTPDEMRKATTKSGKPVFRECETSKGMLWRNGDALKLKPAWSSE